MRCCSAITWGLFFPSLVGWKHYLVSVGADCAAGVREHSRGSRWWGSCPRCWNFPCLCRWRCSCVIAATKWHFNPFHPFVPPHVPPFSSVSAWGLALGLWLYSGYEQCFERGGRRLKNPQRNFPIAPGDCGAAFDRDVFFCRRCFRWRRWEIGKSGIRLICRRAGLLIGGSLLGFALTVAAMVGETLHC